MVRAARDRGGAASRLVREIAKGIITVVTVASLAMECDSEQPDRQLQLWLTLSDN
jgi:hypothetical protein